MYSKSTLVRSLVLMLAIGVVLGHPRAADARAPTHRKPTVLRRSYPLNMNYRMRAHIRGVSTAHFRRAMLLQRLRRVQQLSPNALRFFGPQIRSSPSASRRSGPRRVAPRPAQPTPPSRPLLRAGVGYPMPPWLRGIRLPDVRIRFSPQVYRYLAYYRTSRVGRAVLSRWLGRMNRFKAHISAALRRHHLPQDLIYIAMIESGFRPTTKSWAGASGLWQFMPSGGKTYGLPRSFWVDERHNPESSTEAAMYYLKDLHKRFGNWELALAAYNAGYNGVRRAMTKYNTNDYWRLCEYESGLPYETMRYVPKFFAIAVVANNLKHFGLKPRGVKPAWEYALVNVRGGTRLAQVARLASISIKTLRELNPELRRNRVPPGQSYELRLPKGSLLTYRKKAARSSVGARKLVVHTVRYGDSVGSIAAQNGISARLLRRINQIRNRREVRPGVKLLVPAGSRRARRRHRTPQKRTLIAVTPVLAQPAGHLTIYYPVVAGDDLQGVAKALGVSLIDLIAWNAVTARAKLIPGMVLRAVVAPNRFPKGVRLLDPRSIRVLTVNSVPFHVAHAQRRNRRRIIYRVRHGDTMRRVSRRFGISRGAIGRYNKINRGAKLRPGQRLVLYTRTRRSRRRKRRRVRRRRTSQRKPTPKRRRRTSRRSRPSRK